MKTLMKEMPSPNVTHMLHLSLHNLPQSKDYDVISHGKGVFEFNPRIHSSVNTSVYVLSGIQSAFKNYEDHDAIYPVSITGLKVGGMDGVGSTRFCTMDKDFAEYLTNVVSDRSVVDIIKGHSGWMEMVNVSQYFRFMKYDSGGEHFPHYDSDFVYEYNGVATRYSLVVYFNDCDSGELAFVNDDTPHSRNCSDWERQATDKEIWLKIKPSCMKIVLFPHTLCHTVLPFTDENNTRYICRGDILFKQM